MPSGTGGCAPPQRQQQSAFINTAPTVDPSSAAPPRTWTRQSVAQRCAGATTITTDADGRLMSSRRCRPWARSAREPGVPGPCHSRGAGCDYRAGRIARRRMGPTSGGRLAPQAARLQSDRVVLSHDPRRSSGSPLTRVNQHRRVALPYSTAEPQGISPPRRRATVAAPALMTPRRQRDVAGHG